MGNPIFSFILTSSIANIPKAFPFYPLKIPSVQIIKRDKYAHLRGLPPVICDSLPDTFGSSLFHRWLMSTGKASEKFSSSDFLAHIADRGMGALNYHPSVEEISDTNLSLDELVKLFAQVARPGKTSVKLDLSADLAKEILKYGISAGGARPKLVVSQNTRTGKIFLGGNGTTDEEHLKHYLIKLNIKNDRNDFNPCKIEMAYSELAQLSGIRMSKCNLLNEEHFITERFDRIGHQKIHMSTAAGIKGWDFKSTESSTYEHLFSILEELNVPHADFEQLFTRMVFNVAFANYDDHLKNHSFIYSKTNANWRLAPAYDLVYPLNPFLNTSSEKGPKYQSKEIRHYHKRYDRSY